MPDLPALKAIVDAGGWAAFAAAAFLFLRAIMSGALVPGELLSRTMTQNDEQARATSQLTAAVRELGSQTATQLAELRRDVDELRGRRAGRARTD